MSLDAEIVKEAEVLQAALGVPAHRTGDNGHTPVEEEVGGIPVPAPGLLQVTERRRKYCPLPSALYEDPVSSPRGQGSRVHLLSKHSWGLWVQRCALDSCSFGSLGLSCTTCQVKAF